MALETGVDIRIEVSGEKLLKQAFDSVRLAAKGLDSQGQLLDSTLSKLTGTELKTAETFRKSSDTYKGLQKETVTLARQYEFLAKFSGISTKEARFLAIAQDDLIKKSKELNIHGAARNTFIDSQNKKIVEQIRLNNQLKASIDAFNKTTDVTVNKLNSLEPAVKKANFAFAGMSSVIRQIIPTVGAIGIGSALTQTAIAAIRTADSMSLLKSRMRLTLDETQDFDEVYQRLIQTSINNRASLTDTVTLFNRLSPALKAAGVETGLANTVIDSFQKTLLISGATVRETSSAILQFSQAMAAGRLNGDEFRSISEAAPEFLRAFSRATGVAAGSLKELAADGKLTTSIIVDAMTVMNASLGDLARGIDITFGQAIQILGTRLSTLVDSLNEATGFTKALADTTFGFSEVIRVSSEFISENKDFIDASISAISTLVVGIGSGVLAYKALTAATALSTGALGLNIIAANGALLALRGLTAVLALNPFVLAAAAVVGLTVAFVDLGFAQDELARKTEQLNKLNTMIPETMDKIIDLEAKRDQALASGNMEKAAQLEGKITQARKLLENQTANLNNAEKRKKELMIESGQATAQSAEEVAAAQARLDDWALSVTGANKTLGKLNNTTDDLKFQLANVGKSTIEVAEAKRILTLATADEIIAQADLLLLTGKLTSEQQKEYDAAIQRAEAMKLNADLEVRLAKAQSAHNAQKERSNKLDDEKKKLDKEKNELLKFQQEAIESLYKEQEKNLESIFKNIESTTDEISKIKEQTDELSLSKEALRAKSIASIDAAISTAELALSEELAKNTTTALTFALEDQIAKLKELKDAKSGLFKAEDQKAISDESKKLAEKTSKEFEKIQDDIAKSITDAIFEGGQKGSELLKKTFKAQIFRIFIEPTIRGGIESVFNTITGSGSGQSGFDVAGLANIASQVSNGGVAGLALSKGLEQLALNPQVLENIGNSIFFNTTGALSDVGRSLATNASALSSLAGEIAPYAGSIVAVLQGNIGGGLLGAAGTAIGGTLGGPIGAAIGSAIGSAIGGKLFGGGKISATALDSSFGTGISNTLSQQYKNTVAALGGTELSGVNFGAFGNTGRQGQNPNFTIGASVGGRGVFNSANTREGQADGLFLSGEIALNEANLADQSLRALFSVLKETDFADNIDAVIDSVNTFGDSFESLNTALSDAQLLKTINEEFPKLGGALATLAGQSIETVKTFVLLAGGFENLQNLQNAYISSIYSEEEKLALATQNLEAAFEALGISVPSTTADFKALVEAQNLTSVEGQATYLALLQLSGAFKQIKDAQTQALEEQVAEQERLLEEQQRAAEEAAEALRELAEAYDELNKKTQDYISEITNGALTSLERNALTISELMNEIGSEQDVMEKIALQNELSDLIFERYQLEKEQIEQLQLLIQDVFSAIQSEADNVNQARDAILGVGVTTGSRSSIASRIAQATGSASFNPVAAQANLTAEIERFRDSSLNAVGVLGKLREETVRYYEQQKALSDLMKNTASSIRASINQVQFADLTPQQQLQNLESQFSALYATALTSSGSTLADTGTQIQALIGPLLEKAAEIYASGPEFQRIKELVLGQAGTVADKLDDLAPENYQQESLTLLDQIDQSLIGLKNQADIANQALIASLETASDRAVAALNSLLFGLLGSQLPDVTTQPVTQPALNAPVATLASSEFSGNSATTGGSFGAIVDELKALREDVKNSGDIQIKVVTTDGRVLVDETLTQIKTRSKRGELVIFADGVK